LSALRCLQALDDCNANAVLTRGREDSNATGKGLSDSRFPISSDLWAAQDFPLRSRPRQPRVHTLATHARSNSANTPSIWNMALPLGVVVSMPC
jgi:hypothetical protein